MFFIFVQGSSVIRNGKHPLPVNVILLAFQAGTVKIKIINRRTIKTRNKRNGLLVTFSGIKSLSEIIICPASIDAYLSLDFAFCPMKKKLVALLQIFKPHHFLESSKFYTIIKSKTVYLFQKFLRTLCLTKFISG